MRGPSALSGTKSSASIANELSTKLRLRFQGKTNAQVAFVQKTMALQFLDVVLHGTPVDTGRARSGWQVDIGTRTGTLGVGVRSPQSIYYDAENKLEARVKAKAPPLIVFVSNNVRYIEVLDRGLTKTGRHWSKRGWGFFEDGIALVRSNLRRKSP